MADPAADRVYATARAVLDAVVDYYTVEGVELPARRLVFPGLLPAWDCEMAAVGVERVYNHQGDVAVETLQSIGAHAGFAIRAATLAVWVVRCTPILDAQGRPPPADKIEESAVALLADQQLTVNAIVEATRPTALLAPCNGLAFVDWQTVGPDGGYVGGILRLRISLI